MDYFELTVLVDKAAVQLIDVRDDVEEHVKDAKA